MALEGGVARGRDFRFPAGGSKRCLKVVDTGRVMKLLGFQRKKNRRMRFCLNKLGAPFSDGSAS